MKIKYGQLYDDDGKVVCCGNFLQRCGQHCAHFEYISNIHHQVVLHCCKRVMRLSEAPEVLPSISAEEKKALQDKFEKEHTL